MSTLSDLFQDIADAIRTKTGDTGSMKPASFPENILAIEAGGGDTVVFAQEDVSGFVLDSTYGAYTPGYVSPAQFVLEAGRTYRVLWDGEEFTCTAVAYTYSDMSMVALGDGSTLGLSGNNEPFLLTYNITGGNSQMFAKAEGTHTVAIYLVVSGVSSADLCYVTFMSYDGTVEYGKKAVAVGDDCADPIARGVFTTPTRESTAQYDFAFVGWATAENGAWDETALAAVTEDKTVYAAYASAVRYYTISFYDGDTLLTTKSLAYGDTPSYSPVKTGYTFNGWEPALTSVTGDASYTAQWLEKLDFNTLSWSKIAEYAESGEAATLLEVGATKTFKTKQNVSLVAEIIGFNHDDLADGTGKAGITLKITTPFAYYQPQSSSSNTLAFIGGTTSGKYWPDSTAATYWNSTGTSAPMVAVLPNDLVSTIKTVTKKYYTPDGTLTHDSALWLPAMSELGFSSLYDEGNCYEAYTSGKVVGTAYAELVEYYADTAIRYSTRTKFLASQSSSHYSIKADGAAIKGDANAALAHFVHFCI